jgi:hypothetical protein
VNNINDDAVVSSNGTTSMSSCVKIGHMIQGLTWIDTIADARRQHGNITSQPLCFLSFSFHNPTPSTCSVQVKRATVAPDHTKWHTQSIRLLWTGDQPTQRPLPDNTHHSQQTDIHASGGIRTRNPRKRTAADPWLRPCSHWLRLCATLLIDISICATKISAALFAKEVAVLTKIKVMLRPNSNDCPLPNNPQCCINRNVASMGVGRGVYRALIGKPEEKSTTVETQA